MFGTPFRTDQSKLLSARSTTWSAKHAKPILLSVTSQLPNCTRSCCAGRAWLLNQSA